MIMIKSLYASVASVRTTGVVAVASIISPFWLPDLAQVSQVAGQLMPVFGCVWLAVQIITALFRKRK